MFDLLAQAADGIGGLQITDIMTQLPVSGVLVWYLYFNTTKTIPNLVEKFTASQEAMVERFTQTLREEREARSEELASLKDWVRSEAFSRREQ